MGGQLSSSSDSTLDGMHRNPAPAPYCWLKALTRKRASDGISNEKSSSSVSSYTLRWLSFMMSYTMRCTSLWSIGGRLMRRVLPLALFIGARRFGSIAIKPRLFIVDQKFNLLGFCSIIIAMDNGLKTRKLEPGMMSCGDTPGDRLLLVQARIARAATQAGRGAAPVRPPRVS